MKDERPYYRTRMRVCKECKSNLLIEEQYQFLRARCDVDAESLEVTRKKPVYRKGGTRFWCITCSRSVDTILEEGHIILHSADPIDPNVFHMDSGFSFREDGRICASLGGIHYSGSEAISPCNPVKSGVIDGLIRAIDWNIKRRKEVEDAEQKRWEAEVESRDW